MISFESDYQEGCIPEILQKLNERNLMQSRGYGNDDYTRETAEYIKQLCSSPNADVHFIVGGTLTNLTVISSALRQYQGVVCAASGHISQHETGAIEQTGHKVLTLPSVCGKLSAKNVEEYLDDYFNLSGNEHTVVPGMVYISQSTEVGTTYSLEEIENLSEVCHRFKLPLFIDGARLLYALCSPSCDYTLTDLAALADVFYIGGTKAGSLFGEAVVINDETIKKNFRYCMKQRGALMAKGSLLAVQFDCLLSADTYRRYCSPAVENADRIRRAFIDKGIQLQYTSTDNQTFVLLSADQYEQLSKCFSMNYEKAGERRAVRFCTSWASSDKDVKLLLNEIEKL